MSFSRLPAISSRSLSVSLPHCCFTDPFICFHLPSIRSQFMAKFSLLQRLSQALAIGFTVARASESPDVSFTFENDRALAELRPRENFSALLQKLRAGQIVRAARQPFADSGRSIAPLRSRKGGH